MGTSLRRTFIVDDEQLAIDRLTRLLDETGRVRIVGSTIDPEAALDRLRGIEIDLLFLDIQMPELNGFQVLGRLDRDLPVIFTTAYDKYALEAFAVNSIDYLLKPVEPERLTRALDKLERLTAEARPDVRALARELAAHLSPGRRLERVASRVGDRTTLVDVARVTHFQSRDKLTFAVSAGREHVIDSTLSQLEDLLDPRKFVRIHRGTIVNTAFVQEIYADVDGPLRQPQGVPTEARGGIIVRLKDDKKTELSVARDRVRVLKDRLGI
jgi:two-component system, LytTR family, response regulator